MPDLVPSLVERLGPQRKGDSPLLRRIRAHQSWYRAEVLGLGGWGTTAVANRPLGSILAPADAALGYNFGTTAARHAYSVRRASGWGVDPTRCETYMTSSQALTFNLFGPLLAEPSWFSGLLNRLLERGGWDGSEQGFIEYAPADRARRTGDRTIADLYVERSSGTEVEGVVIETKLADRFSSRFVDISRAPQYQTLDAKVGLWNKDPSGGNGRATNQLARVHALGSTYSGVAATLVVLHHPLDQNTPLIAERYRRTLRDPSLLVVVDLAAFIEHMAATSSTPDQLEIVQELSIRYVEIELSAPAWHALAAS